MPLLLFCLLCVNFTDRINSSYFFCPSGWGDKKITAHQGGGGGLDQSLWRKHFREKNYMGITFNSSTTSKSTKTRHLLFKTVRELFQWATLSSLHFNSNCSLQFSIVLQFCVLPFSYWLFFVCVVLQWESKKYGYFLVETNNMYAMDTLTLTWDFRK